MPRWRVRVIEATGAHPCCLLCLAEAGNPGWLREEGVLRRHLDGRCAVRERPRDAVRHAKGPDLQAGAVQGRDKSEDTRCVRHSRCVPMELDRQHVPPSQRFTYAAFAWVSLCRISTTTFDEAALTPNPSNMKEYNPAAPNGSYDLTKPDAKGNASSLECARPAGCRVPACPRPACLVHYSVRPAVASLTRQSVLVLCFDCRRFKDRDMRKGTFYKTSSGEPITLQQSHEYLERGCMSNPVRHKNFWSATDVCLISHGSPLNLAGLSICVGNLQ